MPSAPPESYVLVFEGVGGLVLDRQRVREVIDGCVRTGAVLENDRPIPPPAKPHGRMFVVVGSSEAHVATEGMANRACLTKGVAKLVRGAAPGSALGIRVAKNVGVARTMREVRLFAPGKKMGSEDKGAVTVLWDAPTLLDLVLRRPLQDCVGDVDGVSSHRFTMKGYSVNIEGADALSACLNPALTKSRFDSSLDTKRASGVVVLSPVRSAMKVASMGASDAEKDAMLEAARHCPLPTDGTSLDFRVDAAGKLTFHRGVANREAFRETTPLSTCIEEHASLPGSKDVALHYTLH